MERRRQPRQPRRLPCELWLEGVRHTGIVRDVSEGGLFVQTRLRCNAGTELEIAFAPNGTSSPELRLAVRVARKEVLNAQFSSAGAGGLGLEAMESATTLAPLLDAAGFGTTTPHTVSDASVPRSFQVKLKQLQGNQSRTLSVSAPSMQGARARALQRLGRGWKVSAVSEG